MIQMNAQQLLRLFPQATETMLEFSFTGVEIDSRKPCRDTLFVAIKGEHFDGHQFVKAAAEQGAVAVLVETPVEVSIPQIRVDDTRQALAELASYWRNTINPLVIAITGSNGKTTVKEMLGRILSSQDKTLATRGNLNNDIGVPLTLFQLSEDDRFAVIEMGANHAHEISSLVAIAKPDVVYVNNAGAAHVEGFGSVQGVIRAKGEMYQHCDEHALAVFNDDEEPSDYWKSIVATGRQLSFSSRRPADVTGQSQQQPDGLRLKVAFKQQQSECHLQVYGEHNAQNALAAITLAIACGLTVQQACSGLNGFSGVPGRLQFITGPNNSLIINDSYNANPDSLAAAVKVLCSLDGQPWLALGDMAEMGKDSLELHKQALIDARKSGVQQFFALGEKSCKAAEIFARNGHCFSRHEEMAEFIAGRLQKGINLLVKGSRSARMEKVVEMLTININHPPETGVNHAI